MEISLTFVIYAVFKEEEICNRKELRDLVKWLEFNEIGFEIYKVKKEIRGNLYSFVREIQIFGKKNMDSSEVFEISKKLKALNYPETEEDNAYPGEENEIVIELPKEIEVKKFHWEPKTKADKEAILKIKKLQNNTKTQLSFYENEYANSEVQTKATENRADA